MKTLSFILLLLVGSSMVFAQSESKKKKMIGDIERVMSDQVAAWNRGDIQGFMEGYWKSDDLRFVSGNSVSKGWQEALNRYKRTYDTREKMGTLTFSDLSVNILDNRNAFAFGRWTLKRVEDQPTGLFTLIFRKTKDGWKIVHDHTSS